MSEQLGKMLICDRCQKEIFIKETATEEKETDGGYTRWIERIYEGHPEGWEQRYFGHKVSKLLDLCPECTAFLDKFIEEFCK